MELSKQPTNAEIKFSKERLALAFAIAGIPDAIGAFATPLPQAPFRSASEGEPNTRRDKLAPPDHSITSSARASSVGGTEVERFGGPENRELELAQLH
jgi:hypothetical protein